MTVSNKSVGFSTHFGRYALGNLLALAAGFVTFPITTRRLTADEFGVLGYWEVWILFGVAVAKLGCSDMIVRFHPAGTDREQLTQYGTNHVFIPLFFSSALWFVATALGAATIALAGTQAAALAACSAILVLLQVWLTFGQNLMAAKEASGRSMILTVSLRWTTVLATLAAMTAVVPTALGAMMARAIPMLFAVIWVSRWMIANQPANLARVDWPVVRDSYAFSIPLAFREIANILLVLGNRLMLRWITGSTATVGIYTIGFSLATYFEQIISTALTAAVSPAMSRAYQTDGAIAVRALKAKVLVPVTHLCICGSAILLTSADAIIMTISGRDKVGAAPVFMVAGVSYLLQAVANIMGMGLLLEKRSQILFGLTGIAAIANVAVNFVLIPKFGVIGAAFATCTSQLLLQAAVFNACSKELRCLPSRRTITLGLCLAAVIASMIAAIRMNLELDAISVTALSFSIGLLFYAAPAIWFEPDLRRAALSGASALHLKYARSRPGDDA